MSNRIDFSDRTVIYKSKINGKINVGDYIKVDDNENNNNFHNKWIITDKENGILVDFFDVRGLSESVINLLKDKEKSRRISKVARDFVVSNYDLNSVTLPKQVKWIANLYNPNSESNSLE